MKAASQVSTVADLVQRLGGVAAVAALLGIKEPAVYNAIARGKVPTTWHLDIQAAMRKRRVSADPSLFKRRAAA